MFAGFRLFALASRACPLRATAQRIHIEGQSKRLKAKGHGSNANSRSCEKFIAQAFQQINNNSNHLLRTAVASKARHRFHLITDRVIISVRKYEVPLARSK